MDIIDNYGLSAHPGEHANPWLSRIMRRLRSLSTSKFLVRLSGERKGREVYYYFYNSQNKTYSTLRKVNSSITVDLLRRELPDPEVGFRPDRTLVGQHILPFSDEGEMQAAELMCKHHDEQTPYSQSRVTRIKVTPTPAPLEPWTFAGGEITSIQNTPTGALIEVEHGKQTYAMTSAQLEGQRAAVRKYVLFNEKGQFSFISSQEFPYYFEMKNGP